MKKCYANAPKQDYKIYALISGDEVYVGKTASKDPKWAYKHHVQQKTATTRDFIIRATTAGALPEMYLLENVNANVRTAFGYCVVWAKYFIEYGYTPVCGEKFLTYTEELTETNEAIYERIKELPLESVLCDDHLLVSGYKQREKGPSPADKDTKNKECTISLHLSPANYELLTYKAKEARMSLSKYCQTTAIHGYVATISVWEYLDELRYFKGVLKKILLAILQHGKYYPADIANVFKLLNMVNDNEKKVVKALKQETEKLVGYKKLKLENYRLKKRIEELEKNCE